MTSAFPRASNHVCSICLSNGVPFGVERQHDSFYGFEEALCPHKPQHDGVVFGLEILENLRGVLGIQNTHLVPVNG